VSRYRDDSFDQVLGPFWRAGRTIRTAIALAAGCLLAAIIGWLTGGAAAITAVGLAKLFGWGALGVAGLAALQYANAWANLYLLAQKGKVPRDGA
jgi:hypothetical protein